jgi:hypothetical protein
MCQKNLFVVAIIPLSNYIKLFYTKTELLARYLLIRKIYVMHKKLLPPAIFSSDESSGASLSPAYPP